MNGTRFGFLFQGKTNSKGGAALQNLDIAFEPNPSPQSARFFRSFQAFRLSGIQGFPGAGFYFWAFGKKKGGGHDVGVLWMG